MAGRRLIVNEETLSCAICLESWLRNKPRVLPCQHTFCLDCLENLETNNTIKCPVCRQNVTIPNGGVINFPRNLLISSLTQSLEEDMIHNCKIHLKELISPPIFCKTCNSPPICEDCLNQDHSGLHCRIIPCKSSPNLMKTYEQAFNDQKNINSENSDILIKAIGEYEVAGYKLLQEEFSKLKEKIREFYNTKNHELDAMMSNMNSTLTNKKQLDSYLKMLPKTKLILEQPPRVSLAVALQEKTEKNRNYKPPIDDLLSKESLNLTEMSLDNNNQDCSPQKELVKFLSIEKIKSPSIYIRNGGFLFLQSDNYLKSVLRKKFNRIVFRKFLNLPDESCLLEPTISQFAMTDHDIYGLSSDNGHILHFELSTPLQTVEFKHFYNKSFTSIVAREDQTGLKYVGAKRKDKYYLFVNGSFRWMIKNALFSGLFMRCNGDIIVQNKIDKTLIFLSADDGSIKESFNIPNVKDIFEYLPHGYIVLQQDYDDSFIYFYDYAFKQKQKLKQCSKILGYGKSTFICSNSSETALYKLRDIK
ncbi:unnamed protein product [Dimorphilus gyrociliatus]|uniref:RING-type domain-containing protein n=1 Tax=Dimorphilus gyrociliatus TaxID=2664684 RepID=A0A7I8VH77_9ANNE|nr:unnamed protein product [Dimorphilus gyrociliatus]